MILIGCGQLTWTDTDPDQVLREIAETGYDGAPGSLGNDRTADEEIAWFASHGMRPAPPYFSGRFWDPADEAQILAQASVVARRVRALGLSELYVAAEGWDWVGPSGKARYQVAGHVSPDDALSEQEFRQFGAVLGAFAEATLAEGVHSCFHNHVGTPIETARELDLLLDNMPGSGLSLGLDTGHIAWAGDDATEVCLRYLDRIRSLHLKDVDGAVRDRGVASDWTYPEFTQAGVFAELGRGVVDFSAILKPLVERGFDGWLIVETDVTMLPSARESAQVSRDYLRSIGF